MSRRKAPRRSGNHFVTGSLLPTERRKSPIDHRVAEGLCQTHEEHEERVRKAIEKRLNTPEVLDFLEAVKIEAALQEKMWEKTDAEKKAADFYWLIGWLGGKAVMDPHEPDDKRTAAERKLHRIITVAAAAYNWHEWTKKRG